jgi:hypothetical protein
MIPPLSLVVQLIRIVLCMKVGGSFENDFGEAADDLIRVTVDSCILYTSSHRSVCVFPYGSCHPQKWLWVFC